MSRESYPKPLVRLQYIVGLWPAVANLWPRVSSETG